MGSPLCTNYSMASWSDIVTAVRSVASQVAVGGDLTHVSLPAVFCFPYSTIKMLPQKRVTGAEILPRVLHCESDLGRMLLVIQWTLSACLVEDEFGKKPLNPILGETFTCRCGDLVYIGEQVSHHPPISAFHFEHVKYDIFFDGTANIGATFWGNSVGVEVKGPARLRFDLSGRTPNKQHLSGVLHDDEIAKSEPQDDEVEPDYEDYVFDPPLPKGYAKGLLLALNAMN